MLFLRPIPELLNLVLQGDPSGLDAAATRLLMTRGELTELERRLWNKVFPQQPAVASASQAEAR